MNARTLILMGKDDRLLPSTNGHILKLFLQDAQIEFLEGAGHLPVLTHMDASANIIESFLDYDGPSTRPLH